ncbi:MAG TPA: hypothetical protein IAB44_08880 [Candidatus Limivivens intestinipullorum]|uniref:Uncharacterized protein n=1 Tax=Candidatus Limivivens intestinipullorum TaxID=2840858 RepID=A0A9D1JJZ9_9FIRM|nr:hypothetical protein [Candidatus Limivivens intestinipullorum]
MTRDISEGVSKEERINRKTWLIFNGSYPIIVSEMTVLRYPISEVIV